MKWIIIIIIGVLMTTSASALCWNPLDLFCIFGSGVQPLITPTTDYRLSKDITLNQTGFKLDNTKSYLKTNIRQQFPIALSASLYVTEKGDATIVSYDITIPNDIIAAALKNQTFQINYTLEFKQLKKIYAGYDIGGGYYYKPQFYCNIDGSGYHNSISPKSVITEEGKNSVKFAVTFNMTDYGVNDSDPVDIPLRAGTVISCEDPLYASSNASNFNGTVVWGNNTNDVGFNKNWSDAGFASAKGNATDWLMKTTGNQIGEVEASSGTGTDIAIIAGHDGGSDLVLSVVNTTTLTNISSCEVSANTAFSITNPVATTMMWENSKEGIWIWDSTTVDNTIWYHNYNESFINPSSGECKYISAQKNFGFSLATPAGSKFTHHPRIKQMPLNCSNNQNISIVTAQIQNGTGNDSVVIIVINKTAPYTFSQITNMSTNSSINFEQNRGYSYDFDYSDDCKLAMFCFNNQTSATTGQLACQYFNFTDNSFSKPIDYIKGGWMEDIVVKRMKGRNNSWFVGWEDSSSSAGFIVLSANGTNESGYLGADASIEKDNSFGNTNIAAFCDTGNVDGTCVGYYVDLDQLKVTGVAYNQFTQVWNNFTSANFASDDINNLRLTEMPNRKGYMILTHDILNDISAGTIGNSTNISTQFSTIIEPTLTVTNVGDFAAQMIFAVDYSQPVAGDTTKPVINFGFNLTSFKITDVINASCNVTDETQLLSANITINFSSGTAYNNFSLSGTSASLHNVTNASTKAVTGDVFNFSCYATDTSNNAHLNSTLFTIAAIGGTCTCPSSGNWEINDGSICNLTSSCDIGANKLRVGSNSGLLIQSGGSVYAGGGCFIANNARFHNPNRPMFCSG